MEQRPLAVYEERWGHDDLTVLLERLKLEHLLTQLDGVCEQAAKSDLDYQGFLAQALEAEWRADASNEGSTSGYRWRGFHG